MVRATVLNSNRSLKSGRFKTHRFVAASENRLPPTEESGFRQKSLSSHAPTRHKPPRKVVTPTQRIDGVGSRPSNPTRSEGFLQFVLELHENASFTMIVYDKIRLKSVGVPINKAKGEKMVLEPLMNSAQRRKLGDITNLQNQKNLMNHGGKQQQQAILVSSKGNAENLQKENMRLMKVVTERDGIKSELKKLKIDFQKVQEQNLLLAQANTRILAEFNTSKDQLKVLQHELGCKNGLVMARKLLLKEQTLPCTRHATKVKAHANACGGACKTVQPNDADHENASESSNVNSLQIIEKANNKRRVSGRKNCANSEVLDIIDRLGETCPTEDNIDNKKLVSDGDNAADKKKVFLDAEDHINDNGQSKRYCAGRPSASFETRDTGQTVNLQTVVDTRENKDDARVSLKKHPDWVKSQEPEQSENPYESRFPLRRRSARLKSQEPEPSESLHESIETTRRRRSGMFNIQELGVIQNLNGLHDDQEIAAKAGCSAREQSTGSKPEAVEPHDTKQITRKSRISLRRQSAIFNFQDLGVTENLNGPHDQTITANARFVEASHVLSFSIPLD
ncbi:hypothetical protein ISN44_As08g007960 [Arabidopsis suecica]|uniref:Shugoshin C-terminal domain-containing protein n=1 Tax=Arabidopsis suecica TaxID=45249 RepID=A0A8T2B516_ARASU|nr:hypothetical protein ISN44_As08g007960 [Arabidopsis suecica]